MEFEYVSGHRQLDSAPCQATALCANCELLKGMPREEPPHGGLLHTRNQQESSGGASIELEHYECMRCPACWLRPSLSGMPWRLIDVTDQAGPGA